jgi:RHS repeat-associated protein
MSLPAYAQENARYVLVLTETAAGGGEAVVATYGGRIERAIDETTIEASVSESRASLMARDPRVKSVTLAGSPGLVSTTWTGGMSYAYDAAGNVTKIGSDAFVYDHADRLVSDTVSGLERRHEYDAFGNRTKCMDVSSGGDCQAATISGATNRITGATYDEAGDLTMYSGKSYTYDGSGMLIRDTGATASPREYVYTADEERIAMIVGSTWYWTLRDFSGQVLREMTSTGAANGSHSNWQWTRDNVWREGQLLSSVQPSGASTSTYHYHLDHLGTPRVVSDTAGTIIGIHDYAAFGTENSGNAKESPESRFKFTAHERDAQGGPLEPLDYMHARYYNAMWGRFLSPDPMLGNLLLPQSWNRYAYVFNNPMTFIDPTGMLVAGSYGSRSLVTDGGATGRVICDETGCHAEITVTAADPLAEMFRWMDERWNNTPGGAGDTLRTMSFVGSGDLYSNRVALDGVQAFTDGVVPDIPFCESEICNRISDPFAANGYYNVNDPGLRSAQVIGATTRDIEIALLSAGATMETRAGADGGNWVTNNAFRWGKGSWKDSGGPRWHFHAGPRRFMGHHLPSQAGTWRMHVTKELMRSLGIRW